CKARNAVAGKLHDITLCGVEQCHHRVEVTVVSHGEIFVLTQGLFFPERSDFMQSGCPPSPQHHFGRGLLFYCCLHHCGQHATYTDCTASITRHGAFSVKAQDGVSIIGVGDQSIEKLSRVSRPLCLALDCQQSTS